MGWGIVAVNPAEGRIEATDTTFWFGAKHDIIIQVQGQGDESDLDVCAGLPGGKSEVV